MKKPDDRFAFLACPYSHSDPGMRDWRFRQACRAAAWLWQYQNLPVYSPISQSHPIAAETGLDPLNPLWYAGALTMLSHASELWVLLLFPWRRSKGVRAEIEEARRLKLPIHYIRYEDGKFQEVEKP